METIKKLVDEKFDYFNRWLNNTRISDDTYTMIYNKMYELQNEIKKIVDEKIQEKDKKFGLLLADRDKLEMYRHNRLKKSDFEIKYWCDYHGLYDDCIMEDENEPLFEQMQNYIVILEDNLKYESLED